MNFIKKKIVLNLVLLIGTQSFFMHAEEHNNSKATAIGTATACTGIGAVMAAAAYARTSIADILQSRPLVLPMDRHFSAEEATIFSAFAKGELNKTVAASSLAGLTLFLSPLLAQAIAKKCSSEEKAEINGLKAATADALSTAALGAITFHEGSFVSSATRAATIFVAKAFLPAVVYAWNTLKSKAVKPTEKHPNPDERSYCRIVELKKEHSEKDKAIQLTVLQKYFNK